MVVQELLVEVIKILNDSDEVYLEDIVQLMVMDDSILCQVRKPLVASLLLRIVLHSRVVMVGL